ncbi:hypothetical protein Tco_0313432 [Tanacetum coccineum]
MRIIDEEVYVSQPPGFLDPKKYPPPKSIQSLLKLSMDTSSSPESWPDNYVAEVLCLSRFQVTPKSSHLSDVKRIFRLLKGKTKLGLGKTHSWQLKKQTIMLSSNYKKQNMLLLQAVLEDFVVGSFVDSKSNV